MGNSNILGVERKPSQPHLTSQSSPCSWTFCYEPVLGRTNILSWWLLIVKAATFTSISKDLSQATLLHIPIVWKHLVTYFPAPRRGCKTLIQGFMLSALHNRAPNRLAQHLYPQLPREAGRRGQAAALHLKAFGKLYLWDFSRRWYRALGNYRELRAILWDTKGRLVLK